MKAMNPDELRELLNKCWMTHDGLWFRHCLDECGMEGANRVNRAAARSIGANEVRRVVKAFGLNPAASIQDLQGVLDALLAVVKADFMDFTVRFGPGDALRMDMHRCFAHDGMVRLGVLDQYECGIFERVEGWFDGLGLRYRVEPQTAKCLLLTQDHCHRDYRFEFPSG